MSLQVHRESSLLTSSSAGKASFCAMSSSSGRFSMTECSCGIGGCWRRRWVLEEEAGVGGGGCWRRWVLEEGVGC